MEIFTLFFKTILFRPYVFVFLAAFLFSAIQLIGWPRTWRFWLISWATAFVCEFSSTRTSIPFGWYYYNGSTVGQELYFSNVPFMASISFSFLLYAAYSVALCLLLPIGQSAASIRTQLKPLRFDLSARTSWPLLLLTAFLFAFVDMVIDPVALRGDRWFLGKIYDYTDPGFHFGVPLANYVGWAVVGFISLAIYFPLERRLPALSPPQSVTLRILPGVGLYYGVLAFNLSMTFWIGESFMGMSGLLMHLPVMALLIIRLAEHAAAPPPTDPVVIRKETLYSEESQVKRHGSDSEETEPTMWLPLIVSITCLFISTPRVADGADQHALSTQHVLGTVMAIDAKHIEVKTPKGPIELQINKKTQFKDQHSPQSTNIPEVGDRVIVMATKNDKKSLKKGDLLLLATEIHFSTAKRVPISREPVPVE